MYELQKQNCYGIIFAQEDVELSSWRGQRVFTKLTSKEIWELIHLPARNARQFEIEVRIRLMEVSF